MLSPAALLLIGSLAGAGAGAPADAAACANLKTLSLPNTTVTAAEALPAGPFTPPAAPGAGGPPPAAQTLPARCRVAAVIKPSSDSNIEMELWLPQNWNGKFQMVGGGG